MCFYQLYGLTGVLIYLLKSKCCFRAIAGNGPAISRLNLMLIYTSQLESMAVSDEMRGSSKILFNESNAVN